MEAEKCFGLLVLLKLSIDKNVWNVVEKKWIGSGGENFAKQ